MGGRRRREGLGWAQEHQPGLGPGSPLTPTAAPGAPSLDLGDVLWRTFVSQAPVTGAWDHDQLGAVAAPCPPHPGSRGRREMVTGPSTLPESGSSPPGVPFSGAEERAGCPLRCGKWTFSSSHKSNPAILGPPPSLEMFIGDCVYSAVTARKRSDIITFDQSPRPAPRARRGPPGSHSHSRAHPRANVVGWSLFPPTLSYNLDGLLREQLFTLLQGLAFSYLFLLELKGKPKGTQGRSRAEGGSAGETEGESLSRRKLSGPAGRGRGGQTPPGAGAWPEQGGADREERMPILSVLFVALFSIISPLGRNLRLQGPRLKILKLSEAELSKPMRSSSPAARPWLPPGTGFPS